MTILEKFNHANAEIQDCISSADATELQQIRLSLLDLQAMVEQHMMKIAGQGGDW